MARGGLAREQKLELFPGQVKREQKGTKHIQGQGQVHTRERVPVCLGR